MESDFPTPDPGLQALVQEYAADLASVGRRWRLTRSPLHLDRIERLAAEWNARLERLPFAELSPAGKIDHTLLRNRLVRHEQEVRRGREEVGRLRTLLPYATAIEALEEALAAMVFPEPPAAAKALGALARELADQEPPTDAVAASYAKELRDALVRWRAFHLGYDPNLDWWVRQPLESALGEMERLAEDVPEAGEIPGRPVGRAALVEDLAQAMVPYSPEELIAIGEREYAWCLDEMLEASREMGHGDDWRAALEAVKETAVPPGEQPRVVRELALEAIATVDDLLTVPDLAKETWRMEMMAAERQKVNPFFLGGETIIVSYPTDGMTHDEKRMSMRGNNPNFSRATVQHELIPGHHLQLYMLERFRPYREAFETPFWIEGWTLYWELLLWERGFPRTPQERIGMLFWRMHRCVRIAFSLRFHLGELTTAECVDVLVDRVGHERANAEGEVRRSFNGLYPPLYQAAYMIGGLQFRAISRELRAKGWSFRRVHDAMLRENQMPPAMMRLALLGEDPPADGMPEWRFDDASESLP